MPDDEPLYVRVYQLVRSDERFRDIWPSNERLGAWLRLLMTAELSWPEPADLPRNVPQQVVDLLVEAGLIEVTGDQFIVHGLNGERERRMAKGRAGGLARTGARRDERGRFT